MKNLLVNVDSPKFAHNCDFCRFLGHYKGYDLYVHPREGATPTETIARDGIDGDYVCGTDQRDSNPFLREARWRGAALGLCLAPKW